MNVVILVRDPYNNNSSTREPGILIDIHQFVCKHIHMNTLMLYSSPKKRVNVSLSTRLLSMIDQTFPNKNRSQVITEATVEKIARINKQHQKQLLKKGFQYSVQLTESEHQMWETASLKDSPL